MTRFTTFMVALGLVAAGATAHAQAAKDEARPAIRPVAPAGPSAGAPVASQAALRPPDDLGPQPTPMPMMPPPPELAAALKASKGAYRCKGFVMNPDGSSRPSVATMSIAASSELDRFWFEVRTAEQKTKQNPHPMKFHAYRTYLATPKTWKTITVDNTGGVSTTTSTDAVGGKMIFTGALDLDGMKVFTREYEEPTGKREVHHWGEYSLDGKTFAKSYDISCKR